MRKNIYLTDDVLQHLPKRGVSKKIHDLIQFDYFVKLHMRTLGQRINATVYIESFPDGRQTPGDAPEYMRYFGITNSMCTADAKPGDPKIMGYMLIIQRHEVIARVLLDLYEQPGLISATTVSLYESALREVVHDRLNDLVKRMNYNVNLYPET